MRVCVCMFKRQKGAELELGLNINEGDLIVDKQGLPLDEVWDYTSFPEEGALSVNDQFGQVIPAGDLK